MPIGERPGPVGPDVDIVDTSAAGPAAIRGGVLRTASLAGGLVLALASTPLLIRHLGDSDFGRYAAVLALVTIVGGLMDGGVMTIALRELAVTSDAQARDRLMGDLLGMRLALSLGGVLVALAFSALAGYGATLVLGTLLAGAALVVASVQGLLAVVLQSRLRFGWAALIEFGRQAVNAVLIVTLVLLDAPLLWFLAVALPAALCALIPTAVLVRPITTVRPAFHPRRWMPLVRDTLVFAVAIAINTLYFRVTLVLMSLVATAAQTGYFAVSFRVVEVLIVVPGLLLGAAFPIVSRAVRDDRERFVYASGRMFELALLLGGLLSLTLLLAAPFAIELLTGRHDHPSVGVLQIQSVALVASFVAAATGYPLLSMHRHRETLLANCVSLVLAVVLVLVLAPDHGARGAAVAAVAADFALAITNSVMLMRRGGPPLPLSAVGVTLAAALAGYAAGRLVGVHPLVEAATGGIVFLFALVALRRFPPELRELLRRHPPRSA